MPANTVPPQKVRFVVQFMFRDHYWKVFVTIYLDFQDRRLIDSPSKRPLPDVDESNSGMELVKKPGDDNSMDMDTA